jgi:DNA-binding transcriptional ArsR family regulator
MKNNGMTPRPAAKADPDFCRIVCFHEEKIRSLRQALLSPGDLEESAAVLKALAHPGRLAILALLAREECCVCDVANVFSWPISTASQHLARLKAAGLVRTRQEGKLVFYSLSRSGLPDLVGSLTGVSSHA